MEHINIFLNEFEEFCSNRINSNKGVSYKFAIKYLCEFLNINIINENTFDSILKTRNSLKDENSMIYRNFLDFLTSRGQKSYLEKGFINAAVTQLILFVKKED